MRSAIILFFILTVPSMAFPTTIYVPDDYSKIQDAIVAAVNGDTILVRPGTYITPTWADQINFLGKQIEVRSDMDGDPATRDLSPQNTVIDGNQFPAVVCFVGNEGSSTVLAGFTITNGLVPGWYGGGIYCWCAGPTISDSIITGNHAVSGGGMSTEYSYPTIINCTFIGNSATNYGGGLFNYHSSPTVTNSIFTGNLATRGGGMDNDSSSPTVTNCTFSGNSATNGGGGMDNDSSSPTVTNCTFTGNSTEYYDGGGMCINSGSPTVTNCTFVNNYGPRGAGMSIWYCSPPVTNCTFVNNDGVDGGGMYNHDSNPTVTNCTFTGNSSYAYTGGGMSNFFSFPTVTNCILWNNSPEEIHNDCCSAIVTYSCVQGGYSGTGNIDLDPIFIDPTNNDYHLAFCSPCKDTGDNSVVTELFDFEGDPRVADGTVDMGVDEFYTHLYWTGDATPGGSVTLKFLGKPWTSPVQLWLGSGVMDPPMSTKYGDWYLKFPVFLGLTLGTIPGPNGVLTLSATLPPTTPTPLSLPFQAGIGVEFTNLSMMEVK